VERIQSTADWSSILSETERNALERLPETFALGASRLIPYKRLDLAIKTGEALDMPVVIAGAGQSEHNLRSLAAEAGVPVHFVGRISDPFLYALYQRAALFVFMAIEDFGIMPVEAMACGTPVLVNEVGGAAESVEMLKGGIAAPAEASKAELAELAQQAIAVDGRLAATNARLLSEQSFVNEIRRWIGQCNLEAEVQSA
jgi:glycosyltransferase involved in cell wall biosynthesis